MQCASRSCLLGWARKGVVCTRVPSHTARMESHSERTAAAAPPQAADTTAPANPAPRPTHFLALQVSHSPAVVTAIEAAQQALVQHTPALEACTVDAHSAHMTLLVTHLGSQGEQPSASCPAVAAFCGGPAGGAATHCDA